MSDKEVYAFLTLKPLVKSDRSHGKTVTYKDIINILINEKWNADVVRLTVHHLLKMVFILNRLPFRCRH
jgi:hypothetical protein